MEKLLGFRPISVERQPKMVSIIIPKFLYLTDLYAVKNEEVLKKHAITHIVSCLKIAEPLYDRKKYKQLIIPVNDRIGENIGKYFGLACEFIETARKENGKVVVHCWGGVSRSSSVILCYLMQRYKLDYETSYQMVRQMKPDIHPNDSFQFQLKRWYEKLNDSKKTIDSIKKGCCKKCRTILFTESELIDHNRIVKIQKQKLPEDCNSFFLFEKLKTFDYESSSKKCLIKCAECKSKVGRFSQMGDSCGCGCKIIVPIYQITKSKIDFSV